MRKKHDKAIATALVIGYSSVFVIHPAVLGILFGSVLSPGRAFADESERIYQQIQNTYQTTPESIASENKLQEVQNKYSDNNESSDSSVTQSLSAKINSYATESNSSSSLDMSKYSSTDFSSTYQSTFDEAAAGGVGINKLQQPGVDGNNININYAPSGTSSMQRQPDGSLQSIPTNDPVVTHETSSQKLYINGSKFDAGSDYSPSDDQRLMDHTKQRVSAASAGEASPTGVAYRTIHDIRSNNYPQTISRNDQIFTSAKSSINEALTATGDWSANCTKGTNVTTRSVHYASWQEHVCQTPKKDNYQSCQLKRDLGVPVYISGGDANGSLSICGDNCVTLTVGRLANNYLNGGACTTFNHTIYMHFNKGTKIKSAVLSSARWDDHLKISLGGEEIFKHIRRTVVTGQNIAWPVNNVDCEESTEWTLGTASSNAHVSGPIDVTSKIQSALDANSANASIPFEQSVAVGDGGEAYSQITIYFENMKFQNTVEQEPAGCYDALNESNGICRIDKWTPIEQGTRMYPDSVLAYGKDHPLYPGDTGYLTWSANADGYACDPLAKQPLCTTDSNGTQHCYNYETIKNLPDGCANYSNNSMCVEKSRTCVPGWYDAGTKQCYMQEVTYSCDEGTTTTEVVKKTTNTCGDLPCIGTDCSAGTPEANTDFSKTAAMLNSLSFIGADSSCGSNGDVSSCRVFPGELKNCGWAVGLAGSLSGTNCCDAPSSGPNMMSAAMTAYSVLKHADWQALATKANTAMNSMTDGVWTNVTNEVTSTAESAYSTASSYLTDVYDSFAGNATEAAAEKVATGAAQDTAKMGIIDTAQQKAMGWAYENVPFANTFISSGSDGYALTSAGNYAASALNAVMIAYTAYQIAVMIAQMLTKCDQDEMETASKISQKSCFKTGDVYCSKEVNVGVGNVCVKRSQKYCCYSSMLPRIIMQQAVRQLPARDSFDCSGLTITQLQQLDWSKIDLTEWIAQATQDGIIPDGAEDLTLQALTGNGAVLGDTTRQTTTERLSDQYGSDKLTKASNEIATQITPDAVDCSFLPRPALCKLQ